MTDSIHTKLGQGRRVAIPADLCNRYHLFPGDPVVLEPIDAGIVMRPLQEVIHEVQSFFADAAPSKVRLSDELIRERRTEAAKDDQDAHD